MEDSFELPASIEAEQSVLGSILVNPDSAYDALEILSASDFFVGQHRLVFEAIEKLATSGTPADVITVSESCDVSLADLVELTNMVAGAANIKAYASVVKDRAVKRQVLLRSREVGEYVLSNPSAEYSEIVDFAQNSMTDIDDGAESGVKSSTMNEILKKVVTGIDDRFRSESGLLGLSSGISEMDDLTNGFKPGELIILAARPSMGKSLLAVQAASNAALSGSHNIIFSLEVNDQTIGDQVLACQGRLKRDCISDPKSMTNDAAEAFWHALEAAARKVKDAPLTVVDVASMHINQIISYAKKVHRKRPIKCLWVDHCHLVGYSGDNPSEGIGQVSRGLKKLARELDCPVVLLCQLNRDCEKRPDKRPMLSDLKASGSLEQDADIILFVYRDDYYNENSELKGIVELYTKKYRNGKLGHRNLCNNYGMARVDSLEKGWVKPEPSKPLKSRSWERL